MILTGEQYNVQDIPEAMDFLNTLIKTVQDECYMELKAISSIDFKEIGFGQHILIFEDPNPEHDEAYTAENVKDYIDEELNDGFFETTSQQFGPSTIIITLTYSH